MNRPTYTHFHLSSLSHNLSIIREKAQNAFVWAVVKADAYGHNVNSILPALVDADGLALLELDRAIALRENGETRPILLLEGPFNIKDIAWIAKYNLTAVIHEYNQIIWLKKNSHLFSKSITIYLKINTGMNRLGFAPKALHSVQEALAELSFINNIVLMTHFANANEKNGIITPLELFNSLDWKSSISIANSATLFGWNTLHQLHGQPGDAVRPGIALYGSSPLDGFTAQDLNLQATFTFKAGIIAIQNIQSNDGVGYGGTFKASGPMRIGIVACGYADGYPRHAVSGTPVWVEGYYTSIVGRISMDMLAIDLTHCPAAEIGSWVELWGSHISIDLVAQKSSTIAYELMCSITSRVKRVYEPI
ncbi:MAG: alanine racemase [Pseudomonadota bacterium]